MVESLRGLNVKLKELGDRTQKNGEKAKRLHQKHIQKTKRLD